MPDQTKPNQTSQSGILHFVKHSVRAYQKKFQLSRSNGSWDTGSGKFKIWKMSNLGFFEKWPPEAPKKGKNQFWWVPWWFWTPMLHQKKFRPFSGPGVIKRVHAHWTAPSMKINELFTRQHHFKWGKGQGSRSSDNISCHLKASFTIWFELGFIVSIWDHCTWWPLSMGGAETWARPTIFFSLFVFPSHLRFYNLNCLSTKDVTNPKIFENRRHFTSSHAYPILLMKGMQWTVAFILCCDQSDI